MPSIKIITTPAFFQEVIVTIEWIAERQDLMLWSHAV